jgi:hypothetical protein
MQSKRKAAADVFKEQNVMQSQDEMVVPEPLMDMVSQSFAAAAPARAAVPSAGGIGAMTPPPAPPALRIRTEAKKMAPLASLKTSEELQLEKEPIRVRETGIWPFKRIIVPPNVYVVHTRLGRKEPVTLGLGLSFPYNPNTDAYLVVPAAMQTIGIVANGISKEKQGINILAYVQWQIHNFSVAYRKLDFSDIRDPLGVVNAQLREQAEAAIKDKIATMSVEEILTDKQPIIEELTARLIAVAEGRRSDNASTGEGLGIKIVTVQLKEAYVSSNRLWEHIQAPFRYEQEKSARVSQLLAQDEIRQKELQNRHLAETGEAETLVEIERIKQSKQTEALQIRLTEEGARFSREQETLRQKIQLEEQTLLIKKESERRVRLESEKSEQEFRLAGLQRVQQEALEQARLNAERGAREKTLAVEQFLRELAEAERQAESQRQAEEQRLARESSLQKLASDYRLQQQIQEQAIEQQALDLKLAHLRQEKLAQLELEEAANRVVLNRTEQEAKIDQLRQEIRNLANDHDLTRRLLDHLPELAANMPAIGELKIWQTGQGEGGFDLVSQFLTKILALGQELGLPLPSHKPLQE